MFTKKLSNSSNHFSDKPLAREKKTTSRNLNKFIPFVLVSTTKALGNLYFVQSTVKHVLMWNFLTHEWDLVEGKSIYTGSIETVASKEKAKFPQQFFPEVSIIHIFGAY